MRNISGTLSNDRLVETVANSQIVSYPSVDTVVIFDRRIEDLALLSGALLPGHSGYVIESESDAISDITHILAMTGAKKIALVAHGAAGVIYLGKSPINLAQLEQRSAQLQEWCVEEISLYSCEVGADASFVETLARVSGARVAASAQKVGAADRGGSWDLELFSGVVSRSVFQDEILASYAHTLSCRTSKSH